MNGTVRILRERRSVKKYKDTKVEKEILQEILEAGTYAANGRGAQAGLIVATQNPELVEKLEKMNARILGNPDSKPFYNAPAVVAVFADSTKNTYIEDGSLVIGNLMNAAYALGVDSCWIHRARQVFETEEGRALAREWGVGDEYTGIGFCILGYREDGFNPVTRPRKEGFITIID